MKKLRTYEKFEPDEDFDETWEEEDMILYFERTIGKRDEIPFNVGDRVYINTKNGTNYKKIIVDELGVIGNIYTTKYFNEDIYIISIDFDKYIDGNGDGHNWGFDGISYRCVISDKPLNETGTMTNEKFEPEEDWEEYNMYEYEIEPNTYYVVDKKIWPYFLKSLKNNGYSIFPTPFSDDDFEEVVDYYIRSYGIVTIHTNKHKKFYFANDRDNKLHGSKKVIINESFKPEEYWEEDPIESTYDKFINFLKSKNLYSYYFAEFEQRRSKFYRMNSNRPGNKEEFFDTVNPIYWINGFPWKGDWNLWAKLKKEWYQYLKQNESLKFKPEEEWEDERMDREELQFDDETLLDIVYGDSDDFRVIKRKTIYSDLEKGYENIEIVIRRVKDNRFFKGRYTGTMDDVYSDDKFKEVYPRTKTITITTYE